MADDPGSIESRWTFERRQERLTIQREPAEDGGLQLSVTENGRLRVFHFDNVERLVTFQSDMEASLINVGWTLVDFVPDRRGGRERRRASRPAGDRRRWWTNIKR
jgi:hypothetical protein